VLAATAGVTVIGLGSPIMDHPGIFVTLRAVYCVGLVVIALIMASHRAGSERMAAVLLITAGLQALDGLTAANSPLPFALGRIAIPLAILATVYVCFAYPSGRIRDPLLVRWFGISAVALATLTAANLLLSAVPPVAGPYVRCTGRACPANPLNLVSLGVGAGDALSTALALATTVSLVCAAVLCARRLVRSTPLRRSSLTPLLMWAVLAALGYGFFVGARGVAPHAAFLMPAAVVVAAIIAVQPFALALGIRQGRVFAMASLERLMADLRLSSSLVGLQQTIAAAFTDPRLRLLTWQPLDGGYADAEGRPVALASIGTDRAVTSFDQDGRPVAAVIHDPILSPAVVEATGSVLMLALDNARLQTDLMGSVSELEASRNRIASAADRERRRIEQDLHDGAQQRLIALRFRLHMLEQAAITSPGPVADGLADAGRRIDVALEDIRSLARGIYPAVLRDLGLLPALRAVARELPIHAAIHGGPAQRYPTEIETAVYFCCAEALQNVAKHCGPGAGADLWLRDSHGGLSFVLTDDGPGFDDARVRRAGGIAGMHDRLEAVGGELTISSTCGQGTTIQGHVPARLGVDSPAAYR
jgi:signal transduction histidine kinase